MHEAMEVGEAPDGEGPRRWREEAEAVQEAMEVGEEPEGKKPQKGSARERHWRALCDEDGRYQLHERGEIRERHKRDARNEQDGRHERHE